jgi:hypothetical protein
MAVVFSINQNHTLMLLSNLGFVDSKSQLVISNKKNSFLKMSSLFSFTDSRILLDFLKGAHLASTTA